MVLCSFLGLEDVLLFHLNLELSRECLNELEGSFYWSCPLFFKILNATGAVWLPKKSSACFVRALSRFIVIDSRVLWARGLKSIPHLVFKVAAWSVILWWREVSHILALFLSFETEQSQVWLFHSCVGSTKAWKAGHNCIIIMMSKYIAHTQRWNLLDFKRRMCLALCYR